MPRIEIPAAENRDEEVKRVFSSLTQQAGSVPAPLKMYSVSPGLFQVQMGQIRYFSNHSTLDFGLLTMVRYLTALKLGFQACIAFNGSLLMRQGLSAEQLEALAADPAKAPLEEAQQKLLAFVLKGVESGESTQQEIDELHALGWSDEEILDCTAHGFGMIPLGKMMKFFDI